MIWTHPMEALPTTPSPTQAKAFAHCHNIQEGPVFIVASGASARDFPIETFSDIPMITMNGAISMFLETGVRPFFYCCTDTSFSLQQPELFAQALELSERIALWEDQANNLPQAPAGELFVLKKAPKKTWKQWLCRDNPDLVRHQLSWSMRNRSIGFSKNLEHGFFDARTVAYLALQIAYHAGFRTAILVGVDLTRTAGRFYETPESIKSPCGLDEHLESRILPSLKLMSEQVMTEDFAVYNLSQMSMIPAELIPKIGLKELDRLVH